MSVPAVLGPFPVVGTAEAARDFRRATGGDAPGDAASSGGFSGGEPAPLPWTFPMRWLAAPDVRAAILALVAEPDVVLVHEAQSFEYSAALHVGQPYLLTLEARRETAPDRLVVSGAVAAGDEPRARLETVLRLVAAPDGRPA